MFVCFERYAVIYVKVLNKITSLEGVGSSLGWEILTGVFRGFYRSR
jgi:hypothetical protein